MLIYRRYKYNMFVWDDDIVMSAESQTFKSSVRSHCLLFTDIQEFYEITLFTVRRHSRVLWDHIVYCSQTFKSSMRSHCLLFADIQEFYEITLFTVRRLSRVLWDHIVYCSQTFKSSMRSRCLLFADFKSSMRSRSQTFNSSMRSRCLLFADIQEFCEITLFTVHRHTIVLWDHVVYCSQTYKSSMRSRCLLEQ